MASITCGSCKATHDSIAAVRACYSGSAQTAALEAEFAPAPRPTHPAATVQRVDYPASEKQVAFITRLANERHYREAGMRRGDQPGADTADDVLAGLPISKREASSCITYLQGCAKKSAVAAVRGEDLSVGMYSFVDGGVRRYFRVYEARSASKHLLAKELVQEDGAWSFVYRGTPSRCGLRSEHRMTREQAAEFGQQYGVCCVCGAFLTDPESVAAGIGPICGARDYYAA